MASETLHAIADDVRGCVKCPLSGSRTIAVPGEGSPNSEIFFIGEGPGFNEDQQGRPFVGPAGKLLDEMLRLVGLRRTEVFITNVVRCRPPGNRDPRPDELTECDEYTQRQIQVLQPKLIVTLGRYSMARFFGLGKITQLHGQSTTWNGIRCIAMYHPAAILRAQTPALRQTFEDDFRKIPILLQDVRSSPRSVPDPPVAESPPPPVDQLEQQRLF